MTLNAKHAAQLVATALIVTAITQMTYVVLGGSGNSHIAYPIWRIESLSALVVALFSFVIVKHHALVGGCLAVGGIFNLIQTGLGLTMFYQLGYGGETPPNPVFFPVLRMSFFLYFAAKAALGVAAIILGMELWQTVAAGVWRMAGVLVGLAGLAALLLNAAAMMLGLGVVPFAGAVGVVAAVFTAIALICVIKPTRAVEPVSTSAAS
jgi:hypothetical protein